LIMRVTRGGWCLRPNGKRYASCTRPSTRPTACVLCTSQQARMRPVRVPYASRVYASRTRPMSHVRVPYASRVRVPCTLPCTRPDKPRSEYVRNERRNSSTVASPGLRLTTSQVPLRALLPSPFPFTAAGLSNGGGRRRVFGFWFLFVV